MDDCLLRCFFETMSRLRSYRARTVFGDTEAVEGKRDSKLVGKPDNHAFNPLLGRFVIHRGVLHINHLFEIGFGLTTQTSYC